MYVIRESGKIIVAGFELEELSKERKSLVGSAHSGSGSQGSPNGTEPENEVEDGKAFLPSCQWMLGSFCGGRNRLCLPDVDCGCFSGALHFVLGMDGVEVNIQEEALMRMH